MTNGASGVSGAAGQNWGKLASSPVRFEKALRHVALGDVPTAKENGWFNDLYGKLDAGQKAKFIKLWLDEKYAMRENPGPQDFLDCYNEVTGKKEILPAYVSVKEHAPASPAGTAGTRTGVEDDATLPAPDTVIDNICAKFGGRETNPRLANSLNGVKLKDSGAPDVPGLLALLGILGEYGVSDKETALTAVATFKSRNELVRQFWYASFGGKWGEDPQKGLLATTPAITAFLGKLTPAQRAEVSIVIDELLAEKGRITPDEIRQRCPGLNLPQFDKWDVPMEEQLEYIKGRLQSLPEENRIFIGMTGAFVRYWGKTGNTVAIRCFYAWLDKNPSAKPQDIMAAATAIASGSAPTVGENAPVPEPEAIPDADFDKIQNATY